MSDLDAFLTAGAQPPAQPAPAPAAPTPPPPAPEAPTAAPRAAEKPPDAPKPEAAPAPDPDADIPLDGSAISPAAWQKARTDWKSKVVAAETEARLLREQVEAFRKTQAQPQQHQAPPPPPEPLDPVRDPVGYHNRLQSVLLNDRLNMSEMFERQKHTPEEFEAAVSDFQAAAQQQPELYAKLHAQKHPYGWLFTEVEKLRVMRDLGDDPAAYKARLRAEWEAEQQAGAPPRVSPAAGLPPSLATTRSAAPRSTNGFSGPPPLDDIFKREAKRR